MGRRFGRWQAALARTVLLSVAVIMPGMAMADVERGRQVAATHCTRCHVVGDINPYGGIESTPSFIGMKRLADWERCYAEFYILPPHPALVRIEEVSAEGRRLSAGSCALGRPARHREWRSCWPDRAGQKS